MCGLLRLALKPRDGSNDKNSVVPTTDVATGCRERALKALADLPPFSPVLDRLLASLSNETISISRIADIIETDTVIAGNVLRTVNSAMYGRRGTVNSVRHAASLLGINKLRNTVFAMSMTRVWSRVGTAPGWSMARFNLYSVACGLLSDSLCQRMPVEYPEGAFAAGLFRDLGQLLIAVALHDEYQEIQRHYSAGFGSICDCEQEVIGVSHEELSAEALGVWNLPQAIRQAVRTHHMPPKPGPDHKYALSLIVHCADNYVRDAGMTLTSSDGPSPELTTGLFDRLGYSFSSTQFMDDFRSELAVLAGALH